MLKVKGTYSKSSGTQMKKLNNQGFGLVGILLIILMIGGVVGAGAYIYRHNYQTKTIISSARTQSSSKRVSPPQPVASPYAGWKTYTSSFEKLSFKYPTNWAAVNTDNNFGIPNADSFQLTSPSGSLSVSWFSAVEGLGGACDATIMPGAAVSSGGPGPCSYWYVLDKQKLAGADLYYVAGVETNDGSTYSPWCGLQASNGIVENEGNIGYMLFMGKNNDFVQNGHDYGLQYAGLMCSKVPGNLGGTVSMTDTKAQATAFLATPEMHQAKLILLSATY